MDKPKILQFPLSIVLGALAMTLLLSGCAAHSKVRSAATAEKEAVALANRKCEREFGKQPFRTGRFPAMQSGDRWLWGWLDAAGGEGFTAQVSFHADRSEPEVEVYSIAAGNPDIEAPDAPRLDDRPDREILTQHPESENLSE